MNSCIVITAAAVGIAGALIAVAIVAVVLTNRRIKAEGMLPCKESEEQRIWRGSMVRHTAQGGCGLGSDANRGYNTDVSGAALCPRCWSRTGRNVPMKRRHGGLTCLACGLKVPA